MIFITGACGFVGESLTKMLTDKGTKVVGLDLDLKGSDCHGKEAKTPILIEGSTLDKKLLNSIFDKYRPTTIVHMGMVSTPAQANKDPHLARLSICEGTKNLVSLAIKNNCQSFIHFSSSHVYGDSSGTKFRESDLTSPTSLYGELKKEAENYLRSLSTNHGMLTHIIRPTSLYGPFDQNKRVVSLFIEKALNKEKFIVRDSKSHLDFTYIDDFMDALNNLIFKSFTSGLTLNIARGRGRTLLELAQIIQQYVPETQFIVDDSNNTDTRKGELDVTWAKETIDFLPKIDLEEGIKLILKAEGYPL